jgi:hypothetical protein
LKKHNEELEHRVRDLKKELEEVNYVSDQGQEVEEEEGDSDSFVTKVTDGSKKSNEKKQKSSAATAGTIKRTPFSTKDANKTGTSSFKPSASPRPAAKHQDSPKTKKRDRSKVNLKQRHDQTCLL